MVKLLTEFQEQALFVSWCKMHPTLKHFIFCIPNGGNNTPQWNVKLKKMGMRAGVSDLFIALPNKKHHGLWLEMKKKKGGVKSLEQVEWINRMNKVGYLAHFAHGFEEAKDIAIEYLKDL